MISFLDFKSINIKCGSAKFGLSEFKESIECDKHLKFHLSYKIKLQRA